MNLTTLFIAFRYWRSKSADRFGRLVTNLASFGIVLGVMALVIVLSVMNGLENMQKRNLLSTLPHAIVLPQEGHFDKNQSLSLPAFASKSVAINKANVIIQSQQRINAGQLLGVENESDDPMLIGEAVKTLLPQGEFNVLIGSRLANKLNIGTGEKIRLMITENSQYTPIGRVPVQRLFNVAGIYHTNNEASEYTLFANLADVGRLLRITEDQVQGMRLYLQDPFQVTELSQYFNADSYKISDWREQKGEFFQAVRMEKNMMGLLISLIIIVAISNIVTSLSLMVVDKQGEIAILQTQGLTKRQVTQIFIFQGAIVGVIGSILGGIIGTVITLNLDEIVALLNPNIHLPTLISPMQVATIIVTSIVLSLVCTLYPAYRAAKIEPAQALRYE
ncbi:lipoprotein-releasing ABC transporter permease subunit [Actinobacillus pleuropneumoniae]|uniref:Lipoprotein-releasing ABC transporter permease subunit n=1 Tax=Actinobacillus pleuropneumoniae TaxID=715 RepID=A0A9Q4H777_ACTPL|nr:lipoprotein-releasing ABC transporter permease subunit [Actinobacillus pleuropneumoniae]MCL7721332.1 lipoprotein-releasing ABC transporter permease subunit [Actinobacillus pleuropneumoniae]MCL7727372.1 lipoprotein-releasing ABC transporter permease subunit [Actinobacillus pleuropneumoniae]MCL7728755.1 lipoprotein-releasing ABC transporter permease subunit [Actinobacillus pleuropneumoniae]MCY6368981.1 lipoprotein-releasing ABC transporter permease subunit [Actinobacillus pleuropneumoniae]MCY